MDIVNLAEKMLSIYEVDINEGNGPIILAQCIKRLSEEYPKIAKFHINTIAGQERYKIEHEGLIKITRVYYKITGNGNEPVTDFFTPSVGSLSAQFTSIFEQEMYNHMYPIDADIVNYNEFDLIPSPTSDGMQVFYEIEMYRTLEEIPEIFEDELINLFFFYERDNVLRKAMREQGTANMFTFDRRGNIHANSSSGSQSDAGINAMRDAELNDIIKNIRSIIMRMRR